MSVIFQDWAANKGNIKGRLVLVCFRLACFIRANRVLSIILVFYLIFYRVFVEWILGIELSWLIKAGPNLRIHHGQALVVNGSTIIGSNCLLRQCTTIGIKQLTDGSYSTGAIIGNNVDIGSGVQIIGPINIGDNVTIGAGSIVVRDIAANTIVAGNPAKIIRSKV